MTLALGTSHALLAALPSARSVWFTSSFVGSPTMLHALEDAARRGADVHVRLERAPYATQPAEADQFVEENLAAVRELRQSGADARLSPLGAPPLHLKAAVVDGTAYLDDRNWPSRGDTVVITDAPEDVARVRSACTGERPPSDGRLAFGKAEALALEAEAIEAATGGLCFETESFGDCNVLAALEAHAKNVANVRAIVGERDVYIGADAHLNPALGALRAAGVEVRIALETDKLCVGSDVAWIGSANATRQRALAQEWALRTVDPAAIAQAQGRFERRWAKATPMPATPAAASQTVLSDPR